MISFTFSVIIQILITYESVIFPISFKIIFLIKSDQRNVFWKNHLHTKRRPSSVKIIHIHLIANMCEIISTTEAKYRPMKDSPLAEDVFVERVQEPIIDNL